MDPARVQALSLYSSRWANKPELRKQTKSFLLLPAEVRNSIYRYSFVQDSQNPVDGINTMFPGIGLLGVNRQIHLESSGILYGNNTFTFGLEIDWRCRPGMILHGFPKTLPVWPAPRYHKLLQRLEIRIRFSAGMPADLEAPEIMQKQIQVMRKAYDSVWDELDIHFKFMGGDLAELAFTMAWLKFRMLEPIGHANCSIETDQEVSPPVRWALEATLQQKDLRAALSKEQLKALSESEEIANDVSEACIFNVATRLAYGFVPAQHAAAVQGGLVHGLFGPGPPMTQSQPHTQLQSQNPIHQLLLNRLPISVNNGQMQFNTPPAAFGRTLMANPVSSNGPGHANPNPFGNGPPPYSLPRMIPFPHQLPSFHNHPLPHAQNAPSNPGPIPLPPLPQPRPLPPTPRLHCNRTWTFRTHLGNSLTEAQAMDILIRDSEMRVLAALDLPGEMEELSIKNCAVLRVYFKLMEKAGEITALKRC